MLRVGGNEVAIFHILPYQKLQRMAGALNKKKEKANGGVADDNTRILNVSITKLKNVVFDEQSTITFKNVAYARCYQCKNLVS